MKGWRNIKLNLSILLGCLQENLNFNPLIGWILNYSNRMERQEQIQTYYEILL